MIDILSERSGIAAALAAQTLRRPATQSAEGPADRSDAGRQSPLFETAREVVGAYLAARTAATRPPPGLAEALGEIRRRENKDGKHCALVGISALPPEAVARFLGQTNLRDCLDHVYATSPDRDQTTERRKEVQQDDWLRALSNRAPWPSPAILKGICALHHVSPQQSIFIGAKMGEEIIPALDLGMRTVQVRLGSPDSSAPQLDRFSSTANSGSRRPDAVVTRVQDLLDLGLFRNPPDRGPSSSRPLPLPERGR
ncbi:hypothetical protein [Telmatospirillum sp.]|uniref:HAD family hydrolase n=1 Tax=Telmatospirillum sp. TaxID=2079197 RepID=UPI002847068D|nr:hypothetical protein [Telmatospirillum sp.]MDR3439233.1 hypothetical protein [Telmatospirillum sp.]